MKRALAAALLSCALAAHAQAPPEPTPPAGTQPAATPAPDSAQNPPGAASPAAQGTSTAAPAVEPPPHPPPAPAVRPSAPKPPAPVPAVTEDTHAAELSALRAEVNRLQSELDAERAAALPAPEETAPGAPAARGPWGWLLVTGLLALVAGFVLGWRLLDRRIRRKYGGLRIY